MPNKSKFTVAGQNQEGEWVVNHPHGGICNGTWKTKESAQESCDQWNGRKSSWDAAS